MKCRRLTSYTLSAFAFQKSMNLNYETLLKSIVNSNWHQISSCSNFCTCCNPRKCKQHRPRSYSTSHFFSQAYMFFPLTLQTPSSHKFHLLHFSREMPIIHSWNTKKSTSTADILVRRSGTFRVGHQASCRYSVPLPLNNW